MLSALFVRIPPPEGFEIRPEEHPELFKIIEEIRLKTNSPRLRKVVLDDEFNAAICQIPRFGLLGGTDHYLIIGFPLLASMSPEHLKAVLAHEFGHVSKDHSAFSCWIYKVRKTWLSLAESCSGGIAKMIVLPFAKWYVPRLDAATCVISRQHEYEADATSAKISGAETAAEALLSIEIQARKFSDDVVRPVWNRSKVSETPDFSLHEIIMKEMRAPISPEKAREYLKKCAMRKTALADSHPDTGYRIMAIGKAHPASLDRISKLGKFMEIPPAFEISAAEKYFGNKLEDLISKLDGKWKTACIPEWNHSFNEASRARANLAELRKTDIPASDLDKRIDLALLTEAVEGSDAALEVFRKILEDFPESPIAMYSVGRLLLRNEDEEGIKLIRTAISKDVTLMPYGVNIVSSYLTANGREDEVENWYSMQEDNSKKIVDVSKNLYTFTYKHDYASPDVPPELIEKVVSLVKSYPTARRAWLVRKDIKGEGDYNVIYLLALEEKFFRLSESNLVQNVAIRLDFFPYKAFVIRFGGGNFGNWRLRKKIMKVPGSLIYER